MAGADASLASPLKKGIAGADFTHFTPIKKRDGDTLTGTLAAEQRPRTRARTRGDTLTDGDRLQP